MVNTDQGPPGPHDIQVWLAVALTEGTPGGFILTAHTDKVKDFSGLQQADSSPCRRSLLTVAARPVVRQHLHLRPFTLHNDGADFAVLVERLVFKNNAAAGRGVLLLLQPAGSTTKRGFKKTKMNKSDVSTQRN